MIFCHYFASTEKNDYRLFQLINDKKVILLVDVEIPGAKVPPTCWTRPDRGLYNRFMEITGQLIRHTLFVPCTTDTRTASIVIIRYRLPNRWHGREHPGISNYIRGALEAF